MPQPISQGPKQKVKDLLDRIPAKHLRGLEQNPEVKPCCRKVDDHDIELFKSREEAPGADIMVITCKCGRRHIRMAAGGGRVS